MRVSPHLQSQRHALQRQQQQQQQQQHERATIGGAGATGTGPGGPGHQGSQQDGAPLPWQSNDDIPQRKEILAKIVTYLQQRKPHARPEWIQKVPLMAKRLEDSLYRSATDFEAYRDQSTLRVRLQELAARLGTSAQTRVRHHPEQHHPEQQQQQQQQSAAVGTGGMVPQRGHSVQMGSTGFGSGHVSSAMTSSYMRNSESSSPSLGVGTSACASGSTIVGAGVLKSPSSASLGLGVISDLPSSNGNASVSGAGNNLGYSRGQFSTGLDSEGAPLPWQSNDDIPQRKEILAKIVTYLQQRKPHARPEWIQKVPLMAKRLEDRLYRSATDFEAYRDQSTLRVRLQELAARLGTSAQTRVRHHSEQHHSEQQQQQQQRQQSAAVGTGGMVPQRGHSGQLGSTGFGSGHVSSAMASSYMRNPESSSPSLGGRSSAGASGSTNVGAGGLNSPLSSSMKLGVNYDPLFHSGDASVSSAGKNLGFSGGKFSTGLDIEGAPLPWQSNDDIPQRKEILAKIVTYLQQRKPHARPEWIQKVPLMAKRLEDSLYRSATDFEAYRDQSTLGARLQELAARLGTSAQTRVRHHPEQHHPEQQQQQQHQSAALGTRGMFPQRGHSVQMGSKGVGSGHVSSAMASSYMRNSETSSPSLGGGSSACASGSTNVGAGGLNSHSSSIMGLGVNYDPPLSNGSASVSGAGNNPGSSRGRFSTGLDIEGSVSMALGIGSIGCVSGVGGVDGVGSVGGVGGVSDIGGVSGVDDVGNVGGVGNVYNVGGLGGLGVNRVDRVSSINSVMNMNSVGGLGCVGGVGGVTGVDSISGVGGVNSTSGVGYVGGVGGVGGVSGVGCIGSVGDVGGVGGIVGGGGVEGVGYVGGVGDIGGVGGVVDIGNVYGMGPG